MSTSSFNNRLVDYSVKPVPPCGATLLGILLACPKKNKVKGGHSRVWINLSKHNWCECTLLSLHSASSLPFLVSLYVCKLTACLDFVWKWNSPIHHHCAWAVVTRVMPFVKLKWDHGNIQLSLCSCQYWRYRYDGYLCQKGRFNTPNTAWKHSHKSTWVTCCPDLQYA